MKLAFDVPVLVRGLPPRCRNPRAALCVSPASINIPEIDTVDFPLALEVRFNRYEFEWRSTGGRLYRRIAGDGFLRESGFAAATRYEMRDFWEEKRALYPPLWPPAAAGHVHMDLQEMWDPQPLAPLYIYRAEPDPLTVSVEWIREAYPGDIDFWLQKAARYFETSVCFEGAVWVEVPEPIFLVSVDLVSGVMDTSWYGAGEADRVMPMPFGDMGAQDAPLFGYWDKDLKGLSVTDASSGLFACFDDEDGDGATLHMPELFRGDRRLEILRLARILAAECDATLARQPQARWMEMDRETVDALNAMVDAVGRQNGNGVSVDDMEPSVALFLDRLRIYFGTDDMKLRGRELLPLVELIGSHLEEWNSRPIDIDVERSAPAGSPSR